ncbi:MAG: CTP--2,3-di-O-geranylgeranyl-sn-glycero-1-phosphate cytidyltransferase [Nanoarchaeota archaeon]
MKKWDFKSELKRKVVHLLSLLFLLSYVIFGSLCGKRVALLLLTFLLIWFLELEFIRLRTKIKIPLISRLWRKKEKDRVGGQVFFLIGAIIALAVFDFEIALVALLMATFGDMAAALIGMKFGKHWLKKIPDRAWEGITAEFAVNLIIGWLFLPHWILILVMALTATFVETVFTHTDDNLMVPVFAGFNGQIALMILNYFKMI